MDKGHRSPKSRIIKSQSIDDLDGIDSSEKSTRSSTESISSPTIESRRISKPKVITKLQSNLSDISKKLGKSADDILDKLDRSEPLEAETEEQEVEPVVIKPAVTKKKSEFDASLFVKVLKITMNELQRAEKTLKVNRIITLVEKLLL